MTAVAVGSRDPALEAVHETAQLFPETEYLHADHKPSTIKELAANPGALRDRDDAVVFVLATENLPELEDWEQPQYLRAVSESEALKEFDDTMVVVAGLLRSYGAEDVADNAEQLRNVNFIGEKEMALGTAEIAKHWLTYLQASPTRELPILVDDKKSSSFVYGLVEAALSEMDEEAAGRLARITVYDLGKKQEVKDLVRKNGMILLDDWAISSLQMAYTIDGISRVMGDDSFRGSMQVNLICSPEESAASGINGVECRAYYSYPINSSGEIDASVTGAHSYTDFGFMQVMTSPAKGIYPILRKLAHKDRLDPGVPHPNEEMSYPLLANVVKPYDPIDSDVSLSRIGPEDRRILDERRARASVAVSGIVSIVS